MKNQKRNRNDKREIVCVMVIVKLVIQYTFDYKWKSNYFLFYKFETEKQIKNLNTFSFMLFKYFVLYFLLFFFSFFVLFCFNSSLCEKY